MHIISFYIIGLSTHVYTYHPSVLTAVFLKLVQCQSQLNRKFQPFLVEVVRFTHTQPIPKRFYHCSFFKGHPCPRNPQKRVPQKLSYPQSDFDILAIWISHEP